MPVELDMPQEVDARLHATPPKPDPKKAAANEAAIAALEAADEPQPMGEEITVRLVRDVDDPISGFHGHAGETLTAQHDEAGDVWVPFGGKTLYLEPEEFELVELQEPDQEVGVAVDPSATPETPATPTSELQTDQTHEIPAAVRAVQTQEAAEQRRLRYLRDKEALQEQISSLAIEQLKLREQAKLCKKESEVLIERLNNLIESWENPPPPPAATMPAGGVACECGQVSADAMPPADQQPDGHSGAEPTSSPAGDPVDSQAQQTQQAPSEQTYQQALESEPIAALGLAKSLQEKLIEAGVETLWGLEMLRKAIGEGRKEWPKGIGKAKVTAIEDAILAWCASNSGRWDRLQGANDHVEAKADAERDEAVKESQPPQAPPTQEQAVSVDDL